MTTPRERAEIYANMADRYLADYNAEKLRADSLAEAMVYGKRRADKLESAAPCLAEENERPRAALSAIARGLTNGQKERGETFQSIAKAALSGREEGK